MPSQERSSRQCSFCARENPADAQYCNACGSPLHLKACAACGSVDTADATRCGICGATFPVDAGGASAAPKVAPAPARPGAMEDIRGPEPRIAPRESAPRSSAPAAHRRAILPAALFFVALAAGGYLAYRQLVPALPSAPREHADVALARRSAVGEVQRPPAATAPPLPQPSGALNQPPAANAAPPTSVPPQPAAAPTDAASPGTGNEEKVTPPPISVHDKQTDMTPRNKALQPEPAAVARLEKPIALCDPARPHLGYCEQQPRPRASIILCNPAKPELGYCMPAD